MTEGIIINMFSSYFLILDLYKKLCDTLLGIRAEVRA